VTTPKPHHRNHWSERFELHQLGMVVDITENHWLDVVSRRQRLAKSLTTGHQSACGLVDRIVDHHEDAVRGGLADYRADHHLGVKRITDLGVLNRRNQMFDESVVGGVLDKNAAGTGAALPRLQNRTLIRCQLSRERDIGVSEHDVGGFATEFGGHRSQILRRRREDLSRCHTATGEAG
jgi:hypothetical protein